MELRGCYPHILEAFDGGDLEEACALHADLLPIVNLLMQAIEPLNKLEKIVLKGRGIIAHDYCRTASYEPDDLMLAELDRFLFRGSPPARAARGAAASRRGGRRPRGAPRGARFVLGGGHRGCAAEG